MDEFSSVLKSFALVFGAEFGDKSQLVCMALAARYSTIPVVSGAVFAFALLNLLAVTVGAAAAAWLPQWLVLSVVIGLFVFFGIISLREEVEDGDDNEAGVGRYLVWSVFGLIFMAELGDKTQLAMAGLGGVESAVAVWVGGTLALAATTVLGVVAGRVLLRKVPLVVIHRVGGILFLGFAAWMAWELYRLLSA